MTCPARSPVGVADDSAQAFPGGGEVVFEFANAASATDRAGFQRLYLVAGLKKWLSDASTYGADFSDEAIKRAVDAMDDIPAEFTTLADLCARQRSARHT